MQMPHALPGKLAVVKRNVEIGRQPWHMRKKLFEAPPPIVGKLNDFLDVDGRNNKKRARIVLVGDEIAARRLSQNIAFQKVVLAAKRAIPWHIRWHAFIVPQSKHLV